MASGFPINVDRITLDSFSLHSFSLLALPIIEKNTRSKLHVYVYACDFIHVFFSVLHDAEYDPLLIIANIKCRCSNIDYF